MLCYNTQVITSVSSPLAATYLFACNKETELSSSAREEKSRGPPGPHKTKKEDLNRNGLERSRKKQEKQWSWKKKSRKCSLKYRRGARGKVWRAWEREMQNWNRFQIWAAMPRATFPKLLQSASLFRRQEGSEPLPRWQPDLGAPCSYTTQTQAAARRETEHPESYSPFP